MRTSMATAALLIGFCGTVAAQQPARPATAQRPAYKREVPGQLLHRTKVSEDSALKIASARIPSGTVQALELENEQGSLIWSFDFAVPNLPGIYELHVSALTGALVGRVEHELPADSAHRDSTHRAAPRRRP